MSQTTALFVDSYRELNSRKLFWISIGLSGLVVLLFLGVGLNDTGISIFGYQKEMQFNATMLDRAEFYRLLFFKLGVDWWLTWIATILALVSTAGIFPDLLTSGSIDLFLSKPISRWRLFLTKYFAGLLFVALQVAVFAAASFLVLRIRGGFWFPGAFLAVPIVLVFYSYLHCICVLLGVLTRSSIAALLLTIVFWLAVIGVHFWEVGTVKDQMLDQIITERSDRHIARQETELRNETNPANAKDTRAALDELRTKRQAIDATSKRDAEMHDKLYLVATLLPKTSETVELMGRWLVKFTENEGPAGRRFRAENDDDDEPKPFMFGMTTDDLRADAMMAKVVRNRPVSWVIGTSLIFEAVVVSLAGWRFCRRDY